MKKKRFGLYWWCDTRKIHCGQIDEEIN